MKALLGVLVVVATAGWRPLHGQPAPRPIVQVKKDGTRETFLRTVAVSGVTRLGVMSGDPTTVVRLGHLSVLLPKSETPGNLCVKIVSADGQYEGRLSVPRSDLPVLTGALDVSFPSDFATELKGRQAADLAIEAMMAKSCDEWVGQVIVASWQDSITDRDFWVVVNSGRLHTVVVASYANLRDTTFECVPVEAARKVAFDVRCRIQFAPGQTPSRIEIRRTRLDSRMPPVPVPIRWQ